LKLKDLPEIVYECAKCIEPTSFGDVDKDDDNVRIYNGFINDDANDFLSTHCVTCKAGLIPSWLPKQQVIRYIKNIFAKHSLNIEKEALELEK
jgi:hypothetical protein